MKKSLVKFSEFSVMTVVPKDKFTAKRVTVQLKLEFRIQWTMCTLSRTVYKVMPHIILSKILPLGIIARFGYLSICFIYRYG